MAALASQLFQSPAANMGAQETGNCSMIDLKKQLVEASYRFAGVCCFPEFEGSQVRDDKL